MPKETWQYCAIPRTVMTMFNSLVSMVGMAEGAQRAVTCLKDEESGIRSDDGDEGREMLAMSIVIKTWKNKILNDNEIMNARIKSEKPDQPIVEEERK